MKRVLALLLLTIATTMQANDVADAWRNLGKKHRAVSALKALITGFLAIEAGLATMKHVQDTSTIFNNTHNWDKNAYQSFARELVTAGGMAYACIGLTWYFTIPDAKHALSVS